jgi:hypothetical protein
MLACAAVAWAAVTAAVTIRPAIASRLSRTELIKVLTRPPLLFVRALRRRGSGAWGATWDGRYKVAGSASIPGRERICRITLPAAGAHGRGPGDVAGVGGPMRDAAAMSIASSLGLTADDAIVLQDSNSPSGSSARPWWCRTGLGGEVAAGAGRAGATSLPWRGNPGVHAALHRSRSAREQNLLERHADLALMHHLVEAGMLLHPGRLRLHRVNV